MVYDVFMEWIDKEETRFLNIKLVIIMKIRKKFI